MYVFVCLFFLKNIYYLRVESSDIKSLHLIYVYTQVVTWVSKLKKDA